MQKIVFLIDIFFNFNLNVKSHWSDVFVLIILYLSARMVSYWSIGRYGIAVFRFFWLIFISLVTSVFAGLFDTNTIMDNILIILSVVLGLAVFDIVDAAWSATFDRMQGLTWVGDWKRYAAFSMPTIVIGFLLILLIWGTYPIWSVTWIKVPGLAGLFVYSLFLATYWLTRGYFSSLSPEKVGTGYQKFRASSNTKIGMSMIESFLAAFSIWIIDAGLQLSSGGSLAI